MQVDCIYDEQEEDDPENIEDSDEENIEEVPESE
jgi:hypothetical protein